jgi:hypothetical protein
MILLTKVGVNNIENESKTQYVKTFIFGPHRNFSFFQNMGLLTFKRDLQKMERSKIIFQKKNHRYENFALFIFRAKSL